MNALIQLKSECYTPHITEHKYGLLNISLVGTVTFKTLPTHFITNVLLVNSLLMKPGGSIPHSRVETDQILAFRSLIVIC